MNSSGHLRYGLRFSRNILESLQGIASVVIALIVAVGMHISPASAQWGDEWMRLMRDADHDTGMDPLELEADWFAVRVLKRLKFPRTKPSAVLYIDDRAHCFTGAFPTVEQIKAFKPWNKP